jgi:uncharacterized protein (TIGR03437 family)
MRSDSLLISLAIAAVISAAGCIPASAAVFGSVTVIGGTAADIALDESRGLLYIADFGANRIDVMSTADNTIQSQMNVDPQPGALAISKDAQFLIVTHYGSGLSINAITVINLATKGRQTFSTGDPPLGVAFLGNGQAIIATTTSILLFDPVSGQTSVLGTFANLAQQLPVPFATFPPQILKTQLATSGDWSVVWGIADAGSSNQMVYRFDSSTGQIDAYGYVTSPPLLPRVSVSFDGSTAMVGWALVHKGGYLQGRYPNVIASTTITGSAIDSKHGPYGTIYGQFPDANQPTGPQTSFNPPAGQTSPVILPALLVMDADNLTVRDRINIPENIVGRALLKSDGSVLYAISESGVMTLPVGSLNQAPRLTAPEDVLIQTNFCNRSALSQALAISDPGGGHTPFTIATSQAGVSISPSSGVTPATVQVQIDPAAFQNANGTTAVALQLASPLAVNQPRPVRLLINNPDLNQRGTVVDQPGMLADILPDSARNRFYISRHDQNQILVYDGTSNGLVATLRTMTSPTMMALTMDGRYLMVGHDDSQLVMVYDLTSLQPQIPVILPGGHFGRSIAVSNASTFILVRDEGNGCQRGGCIDSIDVLAGRATQLPTLGIFINGVDPKGVLTASPDGSMVLLAMPDGTVAAYSAVSNSWIASRKDLSSLAGAFAASNYGAYVVGSNIFNASLVPAGSILAPGGAASGFYFVDQGGYLVSSGSSSGPGVIQRIPAVLPAPVPSAVKATFMNEAPLQPTAASAGASGGSSSGSGSSNGGTTGSDGSGSTSANSLTSFTRTVAPLPSAGTIIVLTTSGFTVLAANYDASVAPPQISSIVNAADGKKAVAPGGLVSVYGTNMSPVNMATSQIPLPTALGDSCLSVNGTPVPLLFVSSQQINAQLPFNLGGNATMSVHTPGGVSDNYLFTVQSAAPSVFMTASAGPQTGLAAIVRADNNQLVTPTNPVHPKDTIVIYLTGMGQTTPQMTAGLPSPSDPLATAAIQPTVTLGGAGLDVSYAGLVPNEVGVYQINAYVPPGIPQGISVPLTVSQGGVATTVNLRVVN